MKRKIRRNIVKREAGTNRIQPIWSAMQRERFGASHNRKKTSISAKLKRVLELFS